MKSLIKLSFILLTVTALAAVPARAADDSATSTTNSAPVKPARRHAAGFTGKIQSADAATMTISASNRNGDFKIKVTSSTKIYKDREPGTFDDAKEGLRVRGSGVKDAEGNWTAHTLHILTTAPKPPPSDSKAQ